MSYRKLSRDEQMRLRDDLARAALGPLIEVYVGQEVEAEILERAYRYADAGLIVRDKPTTAARPAVADYATPDPAVVAPPLEAHVRGIEGGWPDQSRAAGALTAFKHKLAGKLLARGNGWNKPSALRELAQELVLTATRDRDPVDTVRDRIALLVTAELEAVIRMITED